jgi:hypothetical protein
MTDENGTPAVGAGSNPGSSVPKPEPAGLQFDRAEFSKKPELACTACSRAISGEFYRVDGKPLCTHCYAIVNEKLNGGSGLMRFFRAAFFGSLAMLLGSGIYYGVLALTGYEIGLISILVGVIVGSAVSYGSGRRGGWVYQCLAVFLTYTAIVSAYIPILISEFQKMNGNKPVAAQSAKAGTAPKPKAIPAAQPAAGKPATVEENPESAELPVPPSPPPTGIDLIIGLAMLIGLIYALPFLSGLQNILGLAIIGFGMYQAWKQNVRQEKKISGPHFANADAAAQEARAGGA